ncbi:MAG: hypothetical protein U0941_21630 [Planctomycetaceae bacterium]
MSYVLECIILPVAESVATDEVANCKRNNGDTALLLTAYLAVRMLSFGSAVGQG